MFPGIYIICTIFCPCELLRPEATEFDDVSIKILFQNTSGQSTAITSTLEFTVAVQSASKVSTPDPRASDDPVLCFEGKRRYPQLPDCTY